VRDSHVYQRHRFFQHMPCWRAGRFPVEAAAQSLA
jgi:hypothetical protein